MDMLFGHRYVERFMTPDVRLIDEGETIFSAIQIMTHYNISCIVATRNKLPVGILTERDIMRRVSLESKDLKKSRIKEVMSTPLISKPSKTKIDDIVSLMNRYSVRRIVIMDDDILRGIITQTDVVRMSSKYIEIIEIVKLYFYMLLFIGVISGLYLVINMLL